MTKPKTNAACIVPEKHTENRVLCSVEELEMKNNSARKRTGLWAYLAIILSGIAILIVLLIVLFLVAIAARSAGTRPYDFPGSEWQSEEPFIFLRVNENLQMDGYMLLDSQKIEIECAIDKGGFVIYKNPQHNCVEVGDYVLEGNCDCTEQQIILKVKKDYCFGNQYDEIVLNRINAEEGTN